MSNEAVELLLANRRIAKLEAENGRLRVAIGTHKANQEAEFKDSDWFDLELWQALEEGK